MQHMFTMRPRRGIIAETIAKMVKFNCVKNEVVVISINQVSMKKLVARNAGFSLISQTHRRREDCSSTFFEL